jgi:hypothetical protein
MDEPALARAGGSHHVGSSQAAGAWRRMVLAVATASAIVSSLVWSPGVSAADGPVLTTP